MIELYNFMENNNERIVQGLVTSIPKDVQAYARVSRNELKQSIEYLLEAYTDLLVTGEDDSQRTYFKYLAKVRTAQSFKLSDVLQKQLCFLPVIRQLLQQELREFDGDGLSLYNQAMSQLEKTMFRSAATFVDTWQEYMKSRMTEHDEYLQEQNEELGVDLSKFILFRG